MSEKFKSRLTTRLLAVWRMEFPLTFRTVLFCFFTGSLLSVPCGLLFVVRWELFEPPLWTAPFYIAAVVASLLILPFWSVFALRRQPLLQWSGLTISAVAFALFAAGVLFSFGLR